MCEIPLRFSQLLKLGVDVYEVRKGMGWPQHVCLVGGV